MIVKSFRKKYVMGVQGFNFYAYQQSLRERRRTEDPPSPAETRAQSPFDVFGGKKTEKPTPERRPSQTERRRKNLVDASDWLDVNDLWLYIIQLTRDPSYPGGPVALSLLTHKDLAPDMATLEMIEFFRIPDNVFKDLTFEQAWDQILIPFLDDMSQSINSLKPMGVPGSIHLEIGPQTSNALTVIYRDR